VYSWNATLLGKPKKPEGAAAAVGAEETAMGRSVDGAPALIHPRMNAFSSAVSFSPSASFW
jgi:hypothetical protein